MTFVLAIFLGLIISIGGIIIPGMLNMTIAKISIKESQKQALNFALGAVVVVFIQSFLGTYFAKFLDANPVFSEGLKKIGTIIFIILTIAFTIMGLKAKNQKEFNNKRTEMYFELARNIDNLDIEEDQELKRELLVQIYAFDNKGRFALINKDKIKDMLGHSPDKSDALALCNYEFESENISTRGSLDDYM